MKSKQNKDVDKASIRAQIVQSAVASFRIEGITISTEQAAAALKKVEATLEK